MGTGQMFLTMGAMLLLSLVIIRTNNTFLTTGDVMLNTQFGVQAVSLATSMIEEATSKSFDNYTDTNYVTSTGGLTSKNNLGKESGEAYPDFNDFDDYNNLVKVDNTLPSATFTVRCKVCYINPSNPDVASSSVTWHKKITVTVSSRSMQDSVTLSSVFSYWFFR
jgi:hypothetical protein